MHTVLGIPMFGPVPCDTALSLALVGAELGRLGTVSIVSTKGMFGYDIVRNSIMKRALETGADRLLWVDSDMVVPKGGVTKLSETMDETRAALVSGHYRRRGYPYTCVWSRRLEQGDFQVDHDSGVHEITYTGLGLALVDLGWMRAHMREPWFHIPNGCHALEDTEFCADIGRAGGVVLGHAGVRCGHLGDPVVVSDGTHDWLRRTDVEEYYYGRAAT